MDKAIQVVRSSMPPMDEYFAEIADIWENRWLTHSGPKHQKLMEGLREYLDVPYISLFANGHLALEGIFSTFPRGAEVITSPFTFASTTQAIVHCGLVPVFCDIEPHHFTMDADKIESLITEKTCAIAPIHVYGNICDWKKIDAIAKKYDLSVIYDAAHAFGETYNGKAVGTLGDVSMFSFHATKVFHTVEGGALTYRDGGLEKQLAAWRQFGMYGKEDAELEGTNAKMTEFHAAMGLCNLKHIDEQIVLRKQAAMRYRERLQDVSGLYISPEQQNVAYNYAYFPVVIDAEEFGISCGEVVQYLGKFGIFVRRYFYPLTSKFAIYQGKFAIQETPIAEQIASQVLTLPLYSDLTLEDVDFICDCLLKQR